MGSKEQIRLRHTTPLLQHSIKMKEFTCTRAVNAFFGINWHKPPMSIRMIAKELYHLQQKVEELEARIQSAPFPPPFRQPL